MDSKFHDACVAALEQLLAEMRDGLAPSNPELEAAVNRVVRDQMPDDDARRIDDLLGDWYSPADMEAQ